MIILENKKKFYLYLPEVDMTATDYQTQLYVSSYINDNSMNVKREYIHVCTVWLIPNVNQLMTTMNYFCICYA